MPSPKIIRTVLDVMKSLQGWPSLRVLDLSCGEGSLLDALHREGCRVEGTHFRDDDYILKHPLPILSEIPIHTPVDLAGPLPFDDEQFDVVIATEVMEHLPNHSAFLAEAVRITRNQGHLIITTPNINRVHSRLQFAFTGQHEVRSARLGWDVPADDLYTTHHNPVYFPVMHTLLHQNRMRIIQIRFTKCNPATFLLMPLLPLLWLATAIEARHAIKRDPRGGRALLRWLADPRLLFSDQLLLHAQKR